MHRRPSLRAARSQHFRRSGILTALLVTGMVAGIAPAVAEPTQPAPPAAEQGRVAGSTTSPPGLTTEPAAHAAAAPPKIQPVQPIELPNGSLKIDRGPSAASQGIAPLPAVDPAAGAVSVPRAPITPKPPVAPVPLTLPTRPAQDLIDATTTDATTVLRDAGRLDANGAPNLDANGLQPQVASAQFIDPTRKATLQELVDALLAGNLPPDLPVDPLALLQALPDGIPRLTYRVCGESAGKPVTCSISLPLAVPAIRDVTGDGTPDVLVDMVPVAAPGDVLAAVKALLDVQRPLDEATSRLNVVLELLKDPAQVILHPELLAEKLRLQDLIASLKVTLEQKFQALLTLVNLGVALVQLRLPTSEMAGKDLKAHVWGVYDLPTHKRFSVGFDGFRRGSTLPTATVGLFTFSPVQLLRGIYDVNTTLIQVGAGDSVALTAGIASVADTPRGEAIDPTVASVRLSPVANYLTAHAVIDPGAPDRPQQAKVEANSTKATHLDALVLSNHRGSAPQSDRFTQLKVDTLPTTVSATVTRPLQGPSATVHYDAASTIDRVLFADYLYGGAALNRSTQAVATGVPAKFDATLSARNADQVSLDYTASSQLSTLDVSVLDRGDELVGRGGLTKLPTKLNLLADKPAGHVLFTGEQALGSATVAISRNLGAFAPLDGDHATLITADTKIGVSARVTGLKSVDAYFDAHPRLNTVFDPGGQAFTAAGDLQAGLHKARLDISNLPATLSVDADTANRKIAYRANVVVHSVHVAYTNTATGPTLVANVRELPQSIDLAYELGDKPAVRYKASSAVPRIELFASPDHLETLRPDADHYLSAAITDLPSTVDLVLDFPARHLEGTMSAALGGVAVVARFPVQGREWLAMAELGGIPAHFDADFAEGAYRFRGLSGPLGSAKFAVTNHGTIVAPTGLHLAAHYRQVTGDLDGSVSARGISLVEYAHTDGNQTFQLKTDTGGDPVFVDADVVLAANGADDVRLSALGRVDNLPTALSVNFTDGKISYQADKNIGLTLEARVGKIAALNGLGVPLFDNGVAAVANACGGGAGCVKDQGPFCSAFPSCFGVAATVHLPGLPTGVTADLKARTVVITGYRPPAAALQAYVRVNGLVDGFPDIRALATLSGLPSPVDFTVGPINVNGSTVDARYVASAPLGNLQLDGQVSTTNPQFPLMRARVTAGKLPASLHLHGEFGPKTVVDVDNSAPIDRIGVTVTSATTGYLTGGISGVPAQATVTTDLAAKHLEGVMSAPIGSVDLLAHVPYAGRTWSAFAQLSGIPGKFDADFGGGGFRFRGLSGPLQRAAVAVTNHGGALAPGGDHLAVHYKQTSGDLDASAAISGVSLAEYTHTGQDFTVKFNSGGDKITLDGDVTLAEGGADDVRLAALGTLGPIPSSITLGLKDGAVAYTADKSLDISVQAWLGKVAALRDLGAPLFGNGISIVDRACAPGAGCVNTGPFCVDGKCFAATAIVNVTGLPSTLTIAPKENKYSFGGYRPKDRNLDLYIADSVFTPAPLTGAKAWATLTGIPAAMDFTLGPIAIGESIDIRYGSNVAEGPKLTLRAEAYGVPTFGTARAVAVLDPIPGSVHVTAKFAKDSVITVDNSAPMRELSVTATGTFDNDPASGLVAFTGVPAKMEFKAGGFQSGGGNKTPTLNYTSPTDSTLDGRFQAEAKLAKKFDQTLIGVSDAYLQFTDLGKSTTISYLPNEKAVRVESDPPTAALEIGVSVFVGKFSMPDEDRELFSNLGGLISGHLSGPLNLDDSTVSLSVAIRNVKNLLMQPGKKRDDLPLGIGLPAELGYLFQGFSGEYGSVDVNTTNVDLKLTADMLFRIEKPGVDLLRVPVKLSPTGQILFHRYQMDVTTSTKFDLNLGPATVGCLTLKTKPGAVEPGTVNGVHLVSGDGPQLITLVDPGGQVPSYVLNLFAYGTSPFDPVSFDPDFGFGSC